GRCAGTCSARWRSPSRSRPEPSRPSRSACSFPCCRSASSACGPLVTGRSPLEVHRLADSLSSSPTPWLHGRVVDEAHQRISVYAPPTRCWDIATDYERYPEWAKDVKSVVVLERDHDGRGSVVEYRVAGLGRSIRYVLAYDYASAPDSFSWQLV